MPTTAQKRQVEKMKIGGHADEGCLSLFRAHSHGHSRRQLEGSTGGGNGELVEAHRSAGTTVRRQMSVLPGQRAAPAASERGHVVESMVQLLADSFVLELLSVQLI